jgi:hypothetical protein
MSYFDWSEKDSNHNPEEHPDKNRQDRQGRRSTKKIITVASCPDMKISIGLRSLKTSESGYMIFILRG